MCFLRASAFVCLFVCLFICLVVVCRAAWACTLIAGPRDAGVSEFAVGRGPRSRQSFARSFAFEQAPVAAAIHPWRWRTPLAGMNALPKQASKQASKQTNRSARFHGPGLRTPPWLLSRRARQQASKLAPAEQRTRTRCVFATQDGARLRPRRMNECQKRGATLRSPCFLTASKFEWTCRTASSLDGEDCCRGLSGVQDDDAGALTERDTG